jgi:hypothetical protein
MPYNTSSPRHHSHQSIFKSHIIKRQSFERYDLQLQPNWPKFSLVVHDTKLASVENVLDCDPLIHPIEPSFNVCYLLTLQCLRTRTPCTNLNSARYKVVTVEIILSCLPCDPKFILPSKSWRWPKLSINVCSKHCLELMWSLLQLYVDASFHQQRTIFPITHFSMNPKWPYSTTWVSVLSYCYLLK